MSETLQPISHEEIKQSVAKGEESKWNVGPDGEALSEGYTMDSTGAVVWVGEGPEPNGDTAEEESATTTDPLQSVFDHATKKEWYTNSYEDFKEKYSTEESQGELYDFLKKKEAYTNSKGEFLDKYFPIAADEEVKEDPSQEDVPVEGDVTASNGEESSTATPVDNGDGFRSKPIKTQKETIR